MRRKLVKQGAATYTVSLPKEWIDRLNLKPGQEIDIEESGVNLVVSSTRGKKEDTKIKYDFSNIPNSIIHEFMVSLYKSGQRDIEIEDIDKEKVGLSKEIISSTIGFEILGSGDKKLHVVDLSSPGEDSLVKAEQQIYWRLLDMIDKIIEDKTTEEDVHQIDLEVNKLSFFIQRNIATLFSSSSKNFMIYEKVSVLESIGDFLRSFKKYSPLESKDKDFLRRISAIIDKMRSEKADLQYFIDLKEDLMALKKIAQKLTTKAKDSSTLAAILLYKNLKQLFDISLSLRVENFAKA